MAPKARQKVLKGSHQRPAAAFILTCLSLILAAPRNAKAETIEATLAKAYENNPQLNAQRAIVRQSDEGVAQALSGYRPTISANASIGREYTNTK
jgi:outer membrane protein